MPTSKHGTPITGDFDGSDATAVATTSPGPSMEIMEEMDFSSFLAMVDAGNAVHFSDIEVRGQIKDKAELVNVPFIILDWAFRSSDVYGGEYVVVDIKTQTDPHKFFVDGSTGIKDQLLAASRKLQNKHVPIIVRKGLRSSTYQTKDASGNDITGTTFYLNNEQ